MKLFWKIFGAMLVLLWVCLFLSLAWDAFELERAHLILNRRHPYVFGWAAYCIGSAYFWLALTAGTVYPYYAGIGSPARSKFLMQIFFLFFAFSSALAALIEVVNVFFKQTG